MSMNEYWWPNLKGSIRTRLYNLATPVGGALVRMVRLHPRCPCGWRLAQRFDGLWLCGHCYNVAFPERDVLLGHRPPAKNTSDCDCYFCNGGAREHPAWRSPDEGDTHDA